jgi:hypothetical protein
MARPKKENRDPNYNEKIARNLSRRKWEQTHPEQWELQKRNQRFKRRYNITLTEYNELLINQEGVCFLCGNLPTGIHSSGRPHVLHVDHNHITGRVRSLLCTKCNRGLGYFNEDIKLLSKAINYLNDHN